MPSTCAVASADSASASIGSMNRSLDSPVAVTPAHDGASPAARAESSTPAMRRAAIPAVAPGISTANCVSL